MLEFKTTIAAGGRIVMPMQCRKALHLAIGDELIIRVDKGEGHFYSLQKAVAAAQALVKKYNPHEESLSVALIRERRLEAENEE